MWCVCRVDMVGVLLTEPEFTIDGKNILLSFMAFLVYIGITKSLFLFTKKRAEYRWFKQQSNSSKRVRWWKYLQEPEPGPKLHMAPLQGLHGKVLLHQPRSIWTAGQVRGHPPAPPRWATRSDWALRSHTCRLHPGHLRQEDVQDASQRQVAKVRAQELKHQVKFSSFLRGHEALRAAEMHSECVHCFPEMELVIHIDGQTCISHWL